MCGNLPPVFLSLSVLINSRFIPLTLLQNVSFKSGPDQYNYIFDNQFMQHSEILRNESWSELVRSLRTKNWSAVWLIFLFVIYLYIAPTIPYLIKQKVLCFWGCSNISYIEVPWSEICCTFKTSFRCSQKKLFSLKGSFKLNKLDALDYQTGRSAT